MVWQTLCRKLLPSVDVGCCDLSQNAVSISSRECSFEQQFFLLFQPVEGNRFNLLELAVKQQVNDNMAKKHGTRVQANDSVSVEFHRSTTNAVVFGIYGATGKAKTIF